MGQKPRERGIFCPLSDGESRSWVRKDLMTLEFKEVIETFDMLKDPIWNGMDEKGQRWIIFKILISQQKEKYYLGEATKVLLDLLAPEKHEGSFYIIKPTPELVIHLWTYLHRSQSQKELTSQISPFRIWYSPCTIR